MELDKLTEYKSISVSIFNDKIKYRDDNLGSLKDVSKISLLTIDLSNVNSINAVVDRMDEIITYDLQVKKIVIKNAGGQGNIIVKTQQKILRATQKMFLKQQEKFSPFIYVTFSDVTMLQSWLNFFVELFGNNFEYCHICLTYKYDNNMIKNVVDICTDINFKKLILSTSGVDISRCKIKRLKTKKLLVLKDLDVNPTRLSYLEKYDCIEFNSCRINDFIGEPTCILKKNTLIFDTCYIYPDQNCLSWFDPTVIKKFSVAQTNLTFSDDDYNIVASYCLEWLCIDQDYINNFNFSEIKTLCVWTYDSILPNDVQEKINASTSLNTITIYYSQSFYLQHIVDIINVMPNSVSTIKTRRINGTYLTNCKLSNLDIELLNNKIMPVINNNCNINKFWISNCKLDNYESEKYRKFIVGSMLNRYLTKINFWLPMYHIYITVSYDNYNEIVANTNIICVGITSDIHQDIIFHNEIDCNNCRLSTIIKRNKTICKTHIRFAKTKALAYN